MSPELASVKALKAEPIKAERPRKRAAKAAVKLEEVKAEKKVGLEAAVVKTEPSKGGIVGRVTRSRTLKK